MAEPKGAKDSGSVLDGLKKLIPELASLQLAPDAAQHMQFLQGLQQALVKYITQQQQMIAQRAAQMQQMQAQQAAGGMPGAPSGAPGMGMAMGGAPRPGMPAQPGQPMGPPSQGSPGLAMPNPDELRRVLATQSQGA